MGTDNYHKSWKGLLAWEKELTAWPSTTHQLPSLLSKRTPILFRKILLLNMCFNGPVTETEFPLPVNGLEISMWHNFGQWNIRSLMVRFLERFPCSSKETNINKSPFHPLDRVMFVSDTYNCGGCFRFPKELKLAWRMGKVKRTWVFYDTVELLN